MERWKGISFNPKYEVSNYGSVRNAKTKKVLAQVTSNSHRQPQVFLSGDIFREQYTLSQIVYNEWTRKEDERPTYYGANGYKVKGNRIGHRDGNPMNNHYKNLYRY